MMLYIQRHASAEEAADGMQDDDRKLLTRSREKTAQAADGLRAMGVTLDAILTSPIARAAATAKIVAAAYHGAPEPQVLSALGAGTSVRQLVAALRPFSKLDSIMIVGHEPQLSAFASMMLTGTPAAVSLKLKTGGCIALEFESKFEPRQAVLRWMATNRMLRQAAK
jgi:phosphohistidine phosphatase